MEAIQANVRVAQNPCGIRAESVRNPQSHGPFGSFLGPFGSFLGPFGSFLGPFGSFLGLSGYIILRSHMALWLSPLAQPFGSALWLSPLAHLTDQAAGLVVDVPVVWFPLCLLSFGSARWLI